MTVSLSDDHAVNVEAQNSLQTLPICKNEEPEIVTEALENLALDDEPDTRLGQGTLSFDEVPGVHSEAGAHISKVFPYAI